MKHTLSSALAALLLSPAAHSAPADANNNGMSDAWERRFNGYELFPNSILPEDDADGDGVSNFNECITGTDPFDGTPPLGFLQANVRHVSAVYTTPEVGEPVLVSPEAFVISWPTQFGKRYTIHASPDLSAGSWISIGQPEYGYEQVIEIAALPTYSDGTVADKFFWRVAVTDIDSDGDGFSDYDEYLKGTDPWVADRDDDGLPDDWEMLHGLDPDDDGTNDPDQGSYGDPDTDGMWNLYEYWYGTSPNNTDTDDDSLTDSEEVFLTVTDPTKLDTDGDGIPDGQEDLDRDGLTNIAEVRIHHTQPTNPDTDDDKLRDGWEVANGLDPLVYNDTTDPDGDGLTNVQEQRLGLNPLNDDTDDDGTLDGQEDPDGDRLTNQAELNTHLTDPLKADTDNDGLSDSAEINTHLTNPTKHDTDGDGMPDGWEVQQSLNPNSGNGINGATGDPDNDGLDNFREWLNGCDPHNPDTDGDGVNDFIEVTQGSDPTDPTDGGNPPPAAEVVDVPLTVSDPSGSHSEKWMLTLRGLDPRDRRTISLASPGFGQQATATVKLRRTNRYECYITHLGTDPQHLLDNDNQPDYDWEATIGEKPLSEAFSSNQGGANTFFTVGNHWLVDNREIVFTTEKQGDDEDLVTGKKAFLVPVAIEDNIAATGVDIVSNSVAPQAHGYLDALWVMAPISGLPPPTDYSNAMKFDVPLNPSAEVSIECLHAEADPSTVTLGPVKPSVLWRGTGANATSDDTPIFKFGPHGSVVDLPIRVKTMKYRKVKVKVHFVNLLRQNGGTRELDQLMLPTKTELSNHLYELFARQINAWFDVSFDENPDGTLKFLVADPGTDGNYDFAPGANDITSKDQQEVIDLVANEQPVDIRIFLIANQGTFLVGGTEFAFGSTNRTDSTCWVLGNQSGNYNLPNDVIATIGHEIGHVLVGYGHPDAGAGVAELPGTNHSARLMCSGLNRSLEDGKLLVKSEWDEAEAWLKTKPTGDN